MGKPLRDILELEFNLMYYIGMQRSEIGELNLKYRDWFYNRLVKEKKMEEERRIKLHGGKV